MPFNPYLDTYGDDAWTDLEADRDSDSEASPYQPSDSSESPSPRLNPQILELSDDESDNKRDATDAHEEYFGQGEAVQQDEDRSRTNKAKSGGTERDQEDQDDQEHFSILNNFMKSLEKTHTTPDALDAQVSLHSVKNRVSPGIADADFSCEQCLEQDQKCDGVKPVCGACVSLHGAASCTWPSQRLSRTQSQEFNQTTRVISSTPSTPSGLSKASRGTLPSSTTVLGETFRQVDDKQNTRNQEDPFHDGIDSSREP